MLGAVDCLVPEVVPSKVSAYMPGSEKARVTVEPEAEEAGDLSSSASSFLKEKPRTVVFGGSHALV